MNIICKEWMGGTATYCMYIYEYTGRVLLRTVYIYEYTGTRSTIWCISLRVNSDAQMKEVVQYLLYSSNVFISFQKKKL